MEIYSICHIFGRQGPVFQRELLLFEITPVIDPSKLPFNMCWFWLDFELNTTRNSSGIRGWNFTFASAFTRSRIMKTELFDVSALLWRNHSDSLSVLCCSAALVINYSLLQIGFLAFMLVATVIETNFCSKSVESVQSFWKVFRQVRMFGNKIPQTNSPASSLDCFRICNIEVLFRFQYVRSGNR